jgi:dimethylamine/trimethylamine dehydrogenase
MSRDPRFDILFEPVKIGPVTTPNRFYQVPHCTGMGYRRPQTVAEMRGIKAEGGWGVVSTEYCSIHPSADDDPFPTQAIWDEDDVRAHALMVDKVHAHGSLAAIELWHGGPASANLYTRESPRGPVSRPADLDFPIQCRAMDKADIREFRRWHVEAAKRAQRAGFDIVYVYACHWYLLNQFLSPSNRRTDEYGGSHENRVRLLREVIEDTKEAVGDRCAVAVRISASTGGPDDDQDTEEPRATIGMLAELPDLWDVTVADYSYEMGSSRFVKEAGLESTMAWVKGVTTKPVVSVGRFTSPETMVRLVRQGVIDLIGAARPSIADPFLPKKIREGREEDIRECIGCNVCYNGDQTGVPIRCTQNPTMGEEWRRGWHPERIAPKESDRSVLVIGAGPAGLEAAVALGRRGYPVTLAEGRTELGGRVVRESRLPGLAEWARVLDWRVTQLNKLSNVEIFMDSVLDAEQIMEFGADRVALATGARWRQDGIGRWHSEAIPGWDLAHVSTPDDIMDGLVPSGPVLVFDDDHYFMGGVIAEKLRREGQPVTLVTPSGEVSSWTHKTDEQERIQERLLELGVHIETATDLEAILDDHVRLACAYTAEPREVEAASVIMVTSREPNDSLHRELSERIEITRIGDCDAPGMIATSVYAGHRYAREMDAGPVPDVPFRREHARVP